MTRNPTSKRTNPAQLDAAIRVRSRSIGRMVALLATAFALALPAAAQPPAGPRASVTGTVFDSIGRKPIAGATIELVSGDSPAARPFTATSDASGRFSIDGVPFGRYLAGFFHESLDSLGLEAAPRRVDVRVSSQKIDLATPSIPTIIANLCAAGTGSDSTGVMIGHVRDTETRAPIGGASIIAEWGETVIDAAGVREQTRQVTARAEEPGWFAICGLPSDATIQAQASSATESSGFIEVEVPPNGLRYVSFFVGGSRRITLPAEDSTAARRGLLETALRGNARLSGTVVDYTGRPVGNAHAIVWGTKLDVTTNSAGVFSMDGLPGGTHTLEIRVIGFLPVTSTVQLAASRPATASITLARSAEILPTVTVRGEIVYSRHLAEFNRRRRAGFGQFRTAEEIARRGKNTKLSQLLQEFLDLRVDSRGGQSVVTMQRNATQVSSLAGMRTACVPTLFVDGMIDRMGDFDIYYSDEISGVEVYRENTRPSEFVDPSNACGAVVIWTRPPPPKPKEPGPPVPVMRPPPGGE
jgi:hypothetical protein